MLIYRKSDLDTFIGDPCVQIKEVPLCIINCWHVYLDCVSSLVGSVVYSYVLFTIHCLQKQVMKCVA